MLWEHDFAHARSRAFSIPLKRLVYLKDAAKDNEDECIFCAKPAQDNEANLIVCRG